MIGDVREQQGRGATGGRRRNTEVAHANATSDEQHNSLCYPFAPSITGVLRESDQRQHSTQGHA